MYCKDTSIERNNYPMANRKYAASSSDGSKAKLVIIGIAGAAAIAIGMLGYLAVKANEDSRTAALRYNFSKYFPATYNSAETVDGKEDYDADGISNADEAAMRTSMISADTDGDGITDGKESDYGTDPANADSDGDGITDGIEVRAGLDPLSLISDGKTKDADRKFMRDIKFDEGSVTLKGLAGIYGATVDKLSLNSVASNAGVLSAPYELHCTGGYDSCSISFGYDPGFAAVAGITADDLCIFRFDPYSRTYSAVTSVVNTDNNTVMCDVSGEDGVFVLGANKVIHASAAAYQSGQINIHLLIDNSGSMYPKSIQSTSKENDVDFKRLSFATNFVTALENNVKFAISSFTYEFKTLCDFDPDKSHVVTAIQSIRTLGAGFDGTSVERALMLGLQSFGEQTEGQRNVIVLLTDGISTDTAGYTLNDIVSLAKSKNVTIVTISLGDEIDRELLQQIASSTGGQYYPISEANILEGLYSTIVASMDDDIVDDDFDGTPDSYTLYDTGFNSDINGFSFGNFKLKDTDTVDFGMVMLARDWFRNSVPQSYDSGDKGGSFSFEGTTITLTEPLRKVVLQTMQSSWTNPENYLNFLSTGTMLKVNGDDTTASQSKGWAKTYIPYSEPGAGWEKAEILVPNLDSNTLRTEYSENDYAMLRAINCYNLLRDTGSHFTVNSEADLNKIKSVLATGTPILTKMLWTEDDGSCRSRYVLLTALRRDLDDPNIFRIKIYDVNAESVSTATLSRTLKNTGSGKDDFTYTAKWDNKSVSLSCWLTELK